MIRAKAPLRISFCGGGTDVEPYPTEHGGLVLSATINSYAYTTIKELKHNGISLHSLDYDMSVKYNSKKELAFNGELDLIKAALKRREFRYTSMEMYVHNDAPPGSGLGSSSALTVSIVGALNELHNLKLKKNEIADLAYEIERLDLKLSGGLQDQYNACVPANTKILIDKQKTKPIECLSVGDYVLTFNEKTSEKEIKKIIKTYKRKATEHLLVKCDNQNRIQITPEHPCFVVGKGWVQGKYLVVGDKLLQKNYPSLKLTLWNYRTCGEKRAEMTKKQWSDECKERCSKRMKKNWENPNSIFNNEEYRRKCSLSIKKSREKPDAIFYTDEYREKQRKASKKRYEENPEIFLNGIKKAIERKKELLLDDNYRKELASKINGNLSNKYPTKIEVIIQNVLNELCPNEFIYNGDCKIQVGSKYPDFININDKKKLIEVNGDYWHTEEEQEQRNEYFKKLGYETLFIWQSEIKADLEKVKEKILTFIYNPAVEIITIEKIDKIYKEQDVYNIEVEDNNNYFANGILVHNCFGGFNYIEFHGGRDVTVTELHIPSWIINELNYNLLLCYTGHTRESANIIDSQTKSLKEGKTTECFHQLKELTYLMKQDLVKGRLNYFGELLNEAWCIKKKFDDKITSPHIDEMYGAALENGALGAKLCFVPETKVKTVDGNIPIKNIVANDIVVDNKNNTQKVENVINREYSGEMFQLKIRGKEEPIITTPEHPFMITEKEFKGKRINRKLPNIELYKEAKDLKKGDCLLELIDDKVIDYRFINPKDYITYTPSKYTNSNPLENIPNKIEIDKPLLHLIGWYVAEGCSSIAQVQFTLNKKDLTEAKKIQEHLLLLFNKHSQLAEPNTHNKQTLKIQTTNRALAEFFPNLCGRLSANKHFPKFIEYLPVEKQAIVLRAVWLGDGTERICKDKRYPDSKSYRCTYKTVSEKLAQQIIHICHRLGYITSIYQEIKENPNHQTAFIIDISGDDAKAFYEFLETGKIIEVKRRNSDQTSRKKEIIQIDNIRYIKRAITSIEKIQYSGLVYNLEVSNSHTYIANNICVHNCGAGGSGYLLVYCPFTTRHKVAEALEKLGGQITPFNFDLKGLRVWRT